MDFVWLLLGLALLTGGGDTLVRGAVALATRWGVSPLLAGLVIVGFGTSSPELVVSLQAALENTPDIALGNVIGSNIANILLILGLCGLVLPLTVHTNALKRDGLAMVAATVFALLIMRDGALGFTDGVMFLVALAVYLIWSYRTERVDPLGPEAELHKAEAASVTHRPQALWLSVAMTLGGLVLLIVGARLFLRGAVGIGEWLGIPEALIGLTLVAVGTSLPELAVSLIAVLRRQADVAVGNILGSNIFNLLGILGVSAVIQPLPLAGRLLAIDQWVMLAAVLALMAFLLTGKRLNRVEAGVLLAGYVVYVGFMAV
ncbi:MULTISPECIES: calcium/sodium antiporter [unclassified Marinimicrobium]|jgi:cation:H+ antiporter|uniref:calcium/sodium antiporter n=1 Tax=unclassified Marinimicrobium TaxID=2632100 RepID=UPI00257A2A80|nr:MULTISPECIES: calcium/sodium antiporter [unclassified Marinimicrobium]